MPGPAATRDGAESRCAFVDSNAGARDAGPDQEPYLRASAGPTGRPGWLSLLVMIFGLTFIPWLLRVLFRNLLFGGPGSGQAWSEHLALVYQRRRG